MDVHVESSVVLVAMVCVMIAFVIPGLLRWGRDATHRPRSTSSARPRRNTMAPAAPPAAAGRTARLRLRYGRLAIAAVGALAAVTVVVGGVLAPFGVVAGSVPGFALAALAASFIGLRSLAVRERRRRSLARMEAAFAEAMSGPLVAAQPRRASELFDAQTATAVDPSAALTAQEARAEARRAAADAGPRPVEAPTWEPVDVPRPMYVDAAKAERHAPEPFPAEEPKRPRTVTSILQDTRIQNAPEAADAGLAALPVGATPGAAAGEAPAQEQEHEGRINLDAVLQRRRA
ncbi:MAG: hypothetical protein ABWX68_12465 [Arthrobacter sp.]|uniref:hypothetical protein n=1 Tax=Arthrobacter sp. TaxID=1667 RepID=UPI00347B5D4C